MAARKLSELIHKNIKASGKNSFEALISSLLEKLTGLPFYLAQSGSQEGRDISSRHQNSNVFAIECKRYKETTPLNKRDLLGGLTEAKISIPKLDIWILTTTRSVSSQIYEALYQEAKIHGIYFLAIEDGDGDPSSIEVLLASQQTIVLSYLKDDTTQKERKEIKQKLLNISKKQEYKIKLDQLKSQLISPLVGYEAWRVDNNQHFLSCIEKKDKSKSAFAQYINCNDKNINYIERYSLTDNLNKWYSAWTSKHSLFLLLGEEGDGKTWGVARWVGQQIQRYQSFPPVVFLSSASVTTNNALELISNSIQYSSWNSQTTNWTSRIERWLQGNSNKSPILLLVLDGINEHHEAPWWKDLLGSLSSPSYKNSIAVIVTCRTTYWNRYFNDYLLPDKSSNILSPYCDEELQEALRSHEIRHAGLSDTLFPLIRKPRYFNLMVKYRKQIEDSGDITIERLIYEDWKDRYESKGIGLDNNSFQSQIMSLAKKQLEKSGEAIRDHEAMNLITNREILNEISSGGILRERRGSYRISKEYLHYGLGLLLLEQLEEANENKILSEVIEIWLEPHSGLDINAEICHYACLIALHEENTEIQVQTALLHAWVSHQNKNLSQYNEFQLYIPQSPEAYSKVAEIVWSEKNNHPWAQELLMQGFLKWIHTEKVQSVLSKSFKSWLSYVDIKSIKSIGTNDEDLNHIRERILKELNDSPCINIFNNYYVTPVLDPALLRLGRVALGIISYLDRSQYIDEIAIGSLADAIGVPQNKNQLFQWIFITSSEALWNEVNQVASTLLSFKHNVATLAARWMLAFEGSNEAHSLKQTTDDNWQESEHIRKIKERHKKDPCHSLLKWTIEDCEKCLSREDLSPHIIATKINSFYLNPQLSVPENFGNRCQILTQRILPKNLWANYSYSSEDNDYSLYEPILCAYAPKLISKLVLQTIRTIKIRHGESLRQICFKLKEHSLIFSQKDYKLILKYWENIDSDFTKSGDLELAAEAYMFNTILDALEAEEQLKYLLQRPKEYQNLIIFEKKFKEVKDIGKLFLDNSLLDDTESIKNILWFLSSHPRSIPQNILSSKIYDFTGSSDSYVRSLALKILYEAGAETILHDWISQKRWKYNSDLSGPEKLWSTKILCEFGQGLSYDKLKKRISLKNLPYVINDYDMNSKFIKKYASDLSFLWDKFKSGMPALPSEFPYIYQEVIWDDKLMTPSNIKLSDYHSKEEFNFPNLDTIWGGFNIEDINTESELIKAFEKIENYRDNSSKVELWNIFHKTVEIQDQHQNILFLSKIPLKTLRKIIEGSNDLLNKYLTILEPQFNPELSEKIILLSSSFYERLCSVLIDLRHDKAKALYEFLLKFDRKISIRLSDVNISFLDYSLFQTSCSSLSRELWLIKLDSCHTDIEFLELSLMLSKDNSGIWLDNYVTSRIGSNIPLEFSRAISIMAFLDSDLMTNKLEELVDSGSDTWKTKLAELSLERNQKNLYSKHWFKAFLHADSLMESWRCYRLFLQCVDRRYYLWKDKFISESINSKNRDRILKFLDDNYNVIQKSIKTNEKSIRNTFLGQKIAKRQAWPWISISHS